MLTTFDNESMSLMYKKASEALEADKDKRKLKLLYISYVNKETRSGYFNKIINQAISFSHLGLETYMTARNNKSFWVSRVTDYNYETIQDIRIATDGSGIWHYISYINSLIIFFRFCYDCVELIKPDIIYIRRINPITPMMLNFIKSVRKKGIVVLYEYPTYPWENELLLSKNYLSYIIDKIQYATLLDNISAMVCMGHCVHSSYNVIETMNGINLHDNCLLDKVYRRNKNIDVINIIIVAHYSAVHGIEKVLKGLVRYYEEGGTEDIRLMVVGPSEGFEVLKKYVEELKINNHVFFHGYKTGKELDDLYEIADIGLDAIALEIRGEECICGSLKSREYISKGLPFICSDLLDIVYNGKADNRFMYITSHNEKEIDMFAFVQWYKQLEISSVEIQKFGRDNFTWEQMMKPVVSYCRKILVN